MESRPQSHEEREEGWPQGPWIVGTITTAGGLPFLRTESPAHLVEVRLDALREAGVSLRDLHASLADRSQPALLTLRTPEEGGRRHWAEGERERLLEEFFPMIDAIDVEYRSLSLWRAWWERARSEGKWRILSVHWLEGNPGRDRIEAYCSFAEGAQPDWGKIALRLGGAEDLRSLARVLLDHPSQAWALMGLGPWAGLSRIVLSALGSELVYGYLDEPAAPGQPSVEELAGGLRRVGLAESSDRRTLPNPGRIGAGSVSR